LRRVLHTMIRRRRRRLQLVVNNHTPDPAAPRLRLVTPTPDLELPPARHPANGTTARLNHLEAMRWCHELASLGHHTDAAMVDIGSHQHQAETLAWAISRIQGRQP
jgi:hypothetical protein